MGGVDTILLMHSQYFLEISTAQNALVVELIPSRQCGKLGAGKLGKGVEVEAIDGANYQVRGYGDSSKSQRADRPARRRGENIPIDVPTIDCSFDSLHDVQGYGINLGAAIESAGHSTNRVSMSFQESCWN
jgi:hypothetical protein